MGEGSVVSVHIKLEASFATGDIPNAAPTRPTMKITRVMPVTTFASLITATLLATSGGVFPSGTFPL